MKIQVLVNKVLIYNSKYKKYRNLFGHLLRFKKFIEEEYKENIFLIIIK